MGQYHMLFNLTKKEYICPYNLGYGLKLWEQSGGVIGGIGNVLYILLACSDGRGGGDYNIDKNYNKQLIGGKREVIAGRWAGDRIAVIGDYAEDDDIKVDGINASKVYSNAEEEYTEISHLLIPVLEKMYTVKFSKNDGWREVIDLKTDEGKEKYLMGEIK